MFEIVVKRQSASVSQTADLSPAPTVTPRWQWNRNTDSRRRRRAIKRALSCRCASSRCPPLCYLVVPCVNRMDCRGAAANI
jgi:hypothetical protein